MSLRKIILALLQLNVPNQSPIELQDRKLVPA